MKEKIKDNITKGNYINPIFLKEYNLTPEECYVALNKEVKCSYCSNKAKFINFAKGYDTICLSRECSKQRRKERTTRTNQERYGCDNVSQNKEIQNKKEATLFKNYGMTSNEIMIKNSKNEDGTSKCMSKEAKTKRENTLLEKYGTTDSLSIKDGRNRGIDKCNNDADVKAKRESTCLEKYGGKTSFHSKEVQDKAKNTIYKNYGVINIMYLEEFVTGKFARAIENNHIKKLNNIDKEGFNSYDRGKIKQKITNEFLGNWITESEVKDFKDYSRLVWRYTRQNDLSSLDNIELRGVIAEDGWHLDHKYSIFEGFKNGVQAKKIGNILNLEMLPALLNIKKSSSCSITLDEINNIEL